MAPLSLSTSARRRESRESALCVTLPQGHALRQDEGPRAPTCSMSHVVSALRRSPCPTCTVPAASEGRAISQGPTMYRLETASKQCGVGPTDGAHSQVATHYRVGCGSWRLRRSFRRSFAHRLLECPRGAGHASAAVCVQAPQAARGFSQDDAQQDEQIDE